MSKEVIMPQMGESVAEGTILKWLIQEGQRVEKDQPLVEISTDKVDTEVPSPASGVLKKILHREDETLPVGTVIAEIEEKEAAAEEEVKEAPPEAKPEEPAEKQEEKPKDKLEVKPESERLPEKRYSPLVRRLAREYGIDLSQVSGTGTGGRITKGDVLDYIETTQKKTPARPESVEKKKEKIAAEVKEEILPISSKRKIIADRMIESKKTAAHVTATFEVDMSRIAAYRDANKEALLKGQKVHLTYLPFIISAASAALKEYPVLNSSWSDQGIILKKYINIGIAVSIEDGLIVPVIRDSDKKGLIELAKESQDLSERARTKKLKPEEVQGGTFTITNYGIGGSLFGTPIILLPQIAILGVGAIAKRPVIINDAIAVRPMVYLSLSFDHRVIDGAQADKFLSRIKSTLEGWGDKKSEASEKNEAVEKMPPSEGGFGGVW